MTRQRLPNRRDNESREIEVDELRCLVTVGFDGDDRPREIFINHSKQGSKIDTLLADIAVLVSIGLQEGIPPADMAKSLARLPSAPLRPRDIDRGGDRAPASVLGAAIDWLVELEETATLRGRET